MALPTGSGSELIKHFSKYYHNTASNVTAIDGVALHIYTILSIVIFNVSNTVTLSPRITFNDGTNEIILVNPSLPPRDTFVFNDKWSFLGGTGVDLLIYSSGDNINWHVTYIDQDWT